MRKLAISMTIGVVVVLTGSLLGPASAGVLAGAMQQIERQTPIQPVGCYGRPNVRCPPGSYWVCGSYGCACRPC